MAKSKTLLKVSRYKPKTEKGLFDIPVDIIIPYHGQYDKVTRLLESIFKLTRTNRYNICLVDDCSKNEDFLLRMEEIARKRGFQSIFKGIRLEEHKGFVSAIKAGFEATQNPYVCFVNSDCKVEDPNWLRSMGSCLQNLKSKNVRMVAPMTGKIVGGNVNQKGDKSSLDDEHYILEGDNEFLSLYCFMCHRELFDRCGGFFKEYPYGFYEDMEFSFRMRKKGFKQAVCRTSWIYHEGSCTIKDLWKKDSRIRDVMEKDNRERCIADMKQI